MPITGSKRKEFKSGTDTKSVLLLPNTDPLYQQINQMIIEISDSISEISKSIPNSSLPAVGTDTNQNYKGLLFNYFPLKSPDTGTVSQLRITDNGIGVYTSSGQFTLMTADGLSAIGGKIYGSYVEAMSGFFGSTTAGFFISGNDLISGTGGKLYSTGKTSFSSSTAGFFLGYNTGLSSYTFGIGNNTNYLQFNGTDIKFSGTLSGSTIIGAVMSGNTIYSEGYVVERSRIFGNGGDGDVSLSSNLSVTSLTGNSSILINNGSLSATHDLLRDAYFRNLTLEPGITLRLNSYRLFVFDTLWLKDGALLTNNGGNGGNGGNGNPSFETSP